MVTAPWDTTPPIKTLANFGAAAGFARWLANSGANVPTCATRSPRSCTNATRGFVIPMPMASPVERSACSPSISPTKTPTATSSNNTPGGSPSPGSPDTACDSQRHTWARLTWAKTISSAQPTPSSWTHPTKPSTSPGPRTASGWTSPLSPLQSLPSESSAAVMVSS